MEKNNLKWYEYFIIGAISMVIIEGILRILGFPSILDAIEWFILLIYGIIREKINYVVGIMFVLLPFSLIRMGKLLYKLLNKVRNSKYYELVKKEINKVNKNIKNTDSVITRILSLLALYCTL
ncbi:hypothetical protein [Methanotorris formicicus]|uniref:Uncharacterized protein n=1 Tax=Methanotorris formicicus Mc-S-70 TaxID=647171 RepID=H1L1J4_9EURY|nr:hypothetical protein [Methanotorris formicicus]EHP83664.1 hypothetical protein MetfoDRAFT_1918 [Methanotorris formicicus Mc-S-70]